jgi:hypothetical protein
LDGVFDAVTDTALLSGVSYENVTPPAFKSATFSIEGYQALFGSFKMSLGASVQKRPDVTAAKGIHSFFIADRKPTATLNPEACLVATHDFWGRYAAGTTGRLYIEYGTAAGNRIAISGPRVQYTSVQMANENGVMHDNIELKFCSLTDSGADDEYIIAMF